MGSSINAIQKAKFHKLSRFNSCVLLFLFLLVILSLLDGIIFFQHDSSSHVDVLSKTTLKSTPSSGSSLAEAWKSLSPVAAIKSYSKLRKLCIHNRKYDPLLPNVKLVFYVLYHNPESKKIALNWCRCRSWAKPIMIPTTPFFESIFYRDFLPYLKHEWESADFVGFGSYRSIFIMGDVAHLQLSLAAAANKTYSVVPLLHDNRMLIPQAIEGHSPQFVAVWEGLLTSMGFNHSYIRQFDRVTTFYRNSYITTPGFMKHIISFMNRALEISLKNSTVAALLEADANYKEPSPGVADRAFNKSYYMWHPFVYERLPVFYFNHIGASILVPAPVY